MTVWVLQYEHKHGTSISVWADEEVARTAMESIVRTYRDDWDVPKKLSTSEAVETWFELTGGNEAFWLEEEPISGMHQAKKYMG
jgi:hypothetical protein